MISAVLASLKCSSALHCHQTVHKFLNQMTLAILLKSRTTYHYQPFRLFGHTFEFASLVQCIHLFFEGWILCKALKRFSGIDSFWKDTFHVKKHPPYIFNPPHIIRWPSFNSSANHFEWNLVRSDEHLMWIGPTLFKFAQYQGISMSSSKFKIIQSVRRQCAYILNIKVTSIRRVLDCKIL